MVDWGKLGHSDWGQAQFLFDGSNGRVLIEKGHHVWTKIPPSFLSFGQLQSFRKNGYLVLRGAVGKDLVQRARRAILADMQVMPFRCHGNRACETFSRQRVPQSPFVSVLTTMRLVSLIRNSKKMHAGHLHRC